MQRNYENNRFAQAPQAEIQRSSFDRSHTHKTTINENYLYPILVDEVLPGDTHNVDMHAFARMATPIFPVMDNLYIDTFFFFVPNRLLWDNWEHLCGAQDPNDDPLDYEVPSLNSYPATPGDFEETIFDFMGLPQTPPDEGEGAFHINSLPLRAYNLIWYEWFRDQNLQGPLSTTLNTGDGPDSHTDYQLLKRGKRHDYFTSALPWPQKGDTSSVIPLGNSAPVVPRDNPDLGAGNTATPTFSGSVDTSTQLYPASAGVHTAPDYSEADWRLSSGSTSSGQQPLLWENPALEADLTAATAATINQLRESFQIQRLLERDARGGTRYTEILKSHFGVTSPDFRLQRPEYLGGGSAPIQMQDIPQTSETSTDSPQGNLAAMATGQINNHGFSKSFVEHGYIIGLINIRADLTYQQGLNRMWSRKTRYDFYWPAFAHLGEQEVLSKEIYCDNSSNDQNIFGYQERYAEYRYKPSYITGAFRSTHSQPLDAWHLAEEFATRPQLNATFIEQNTPVDRVVAVADEPHFILDTFTQMRSARPMPVYAVPGLIDHL